MRMQHRIPTALLLALDSIYLIGCENENYSAISCHPDTAQVGVPNCASENGINLPENQVSQTEYEYKGGVTGRVLGADYWVEATICFDINRNGSCDAASEPVENIWDSGQFSFVPEAFIGVGSETPLLARNAAGAEIPQALYAPVPNSSTSDNVVVNPFTTLVVNETRFNPASLASDAVARETLGSGSPVIGSIDDFNGNDYLEDADILATANATSIAITLAKAQTLSPEKHYQATAAVVDRIYQTGMLDVDVIAADIENQEPLGDSLNGVLEVPAESWPLGHEEEVSVTLDISSDLAVVGSVYHNRLITFDVAGDDPVRLGLGDFASSPVDRDEIDAVTGASEQVINTLELSPDSVTAVVAIEKYKQSSDERGVGLYRANLSQPAIIPASRFGEDETATTDFFPFPGLNDLALSGDGSRLVLAGEDRVLVALNYQTFSLDTSIAFQSKVRAVGIDNAGQYAFAALFGMRTGLATVDLASGDEVGFLGTGSQYPEQIVTFANDTRLAFYLRKGKVLFIYDITDPVEPVLVNEVETSRKIKAFAMSDDASLVILGVVDGFVELYSLENGARLIDSFETETDDEGTAKPVNDLGFVNNSRALVSIKNGFQVLDIEITPQREWSEAELQQWYDEHRKPL